MITYNLGKVNRSSMILPFSRSQNFLFFTDLLLRRRVITTHLTHYLKKHKKLNKTTSKILKFEQLNNFEENWRRKRTEKYSKQKHQTADDQRNTNTAYYRARRVYNNFPPARDM